MNRRSLSKERTIGTGGTGVVEAVWSPDFEGPVALKYLSEWARLGPERERNIARFRTEVGLLRDRLAHPNVIRILHAELEGDDPWFLMPLAPRSLAEEVPQGGLLDDQVRDLFGQIVAAVEHAHGRGVLHRDLKPDNVLMFDGRPVVSDFGLGRNLDSHTARVTTVSYYGGTSGFTAPEQLTNFADADRRSDVYGLGSLLYFMVTGRSPEFFEVRLVPSRYRRIVERCRQYEPARRYQSVGELRADFEGLWQDQPDETPRVQRAKDLMQGAATSDDARDLLIGLYLRNRDDSDLYTSTLPEWSNELIAAQVAADPGQFGEIIAAFCDLLPGSLQFAFLDTAAGFLGRVFGASDDPELRELILKRLLEMAVRNNRYHVGKVFLGLVRELESPPERMLARDVLNADPAVIRWLADNVWGAADVPILKEMLQALEVDEAASSAGRSRGSANEASAGSAPTRTADWEAMEDRNERSDPLREFHQEMMLRRREEERQESERATRADEFRRFLGRVAEPALNDVAAVLAETGRRCRVAQFEEAAALDLGQSLERVAIVVSAEDVPDFLCIVYAVIVPNRAFVKKRYTEVDRDVFPPRPGISTRWADYALIGDSPKLNDAKTITREEVLESVLDAYRDFLRDLDQ